jgi:hypothetical protein
MRHDREIPLVKEDHHNLHRSCGVVWEIKTLRWILHVKNMGKTRNMYKILTQKLNL